MGFRVARGLEGKRMQKVRESVQRMGSGLNKMEDGSKSEKEVISMSPTGQNKLGMPRRGIAYFVYRKSCSDQLKFYVSLS